MFRNWIVGITILFFVLCISGCSHSLNEEKKDAIKKAEQEFNGKHEIAKKQSNNLQFYLPFGMSIKDKSANNVIIKKSGLDYILFYNQNEKNSSKIVYEMSKPQKDVLVDKVFEKKNKFGYVIVSKVKKELFEVIVGVGGIKMTTECNRNDIADNVETMMKIVTSAKYK